MEQRTAMAMRKNPETPSPFDWNAEFGSSCNLDLSLSTPASSDCNNKCNAKTKDEGRRQQQQQRMTIIYDGKVCVYDATELQARSIIYQASKRGGEEMRERATPSMSSPFDRQTEISMKRSLQRFLEKRRVRIQSIKSPYYRHTSTTECK